MDVWRNVNTKAPARSAATSQPYRRLCCQNMVRVCLVNWYMQCVLPHNNANVPSESYLGGIFSNYGEGDPYAHPDSLWNGGAGRRGGDPRFLPRTTVGTGFEPVRDFSHTLSKRAP